MRGSSGRLISSGTYRPLPTRGESPQLGISGHRGLIRPGDAPDDGITELAGMAVPWREEDRRDLRRGPTENLLDVLQEAAFLPGPPPRWLRTNEHFHGRIGRFRLAPRAGAVAEVASLAGLGIAQTDLHDRHLSLFFLPGPGDDGLGRDEDRFVDPQPYLLVVDEETRLAIARILDQLDPALFQRTADRRVGQQHQVELLAGRHRRVGSFDGVERLGEAR